MSNNAVKYFKNTELAKIYNVSEKSVRNWIIAAREEKLDLQLYESRGKLFVANTSRNTSLVEQLVKKGQKYKNSRAFKKVVPSKKFYELFAPKQVFDIISNLDIHREIPYQYSYFDGGAEYWDKYSNRLFEDDEMNTLTATVQLLRINRDYIDSLVSGYKNVNVVDVGVGNCLPVKEFLAHLLEKGTLNRYIGIDLSKDILDIAEKNVRDWFGTKLTFEKHVMDIRYERFYDLLAEDSFQEKTGSTINIVLFLGGTISNLREPDQALHIINTSMGRDDIFVLSRKVDSEKARRHFDFSVSVETISLALQDRLILDLLNIDETYYVVEQFFDEHKQERVIQARLKIDLSIEFLFNGYKKNIQLRKGEALLLWRAKHQKTKEMIDQLDQNSFDLVQMVKTGDGEHSLLMSKIKTTD